MQERRATTRKERCNTEAEFALRLVREDPALQQNTAFVSTFAYQY